MYGIFKLIYLYRGKVRFRTTNESLLILSLYITRTEGLESVTECDLVSTITLLSYNLTEDDRLIEGIVRILPYNLLLTLRSSIE